MSEMSHQPPDDATRSAVVDVSPDEPGIATDGSRPAAADQHVRHRSPGHMPPWLRAAAHPEVAGIAHRAAGRHARPGLGASPDAGHRAGGSRQVDPPGALRVGCAGTRGVVPRGWLGPRPGAHAATPGAGVARGGPGAAWWLGDRRGCPGGARRRAAGTHVAGHRRPAHARVDRRRADARALHRTGAIDAHHRGRQPGLAGHERAPLQGRG